MARRVNPAEGKTETTEHEEQTPMVGGSPGVPAETTGGVALPGHAAASAQAAPDPDAPPPPEVKRYAVEFGSPKQVVYAGYPVMLPAGKVVDDANYDIEGLKKQGVRLRPL